MNEEKLPEQAAEEKSETEANLDEAVNIKYLRPRDFILFRSDSGGLRLTLKDDRSFVRVKARRCFPFSIPNRFVSLRDGNDEEIGIIADLADLSKEYRRWLEEDLHIRYFTPRVTAIKSIRYRPGGVEWHIDTDRGSKRIMTKSVHDTMSELEPGRYIITDVEGNRYELFIAELDDASRAKLERLV